MLSGSWRVLDGKFSRLSHTHSNPNSHTHPDTNAYSNFNFNSNSNSNSYSYPQTNGDSYTHPNTESHGYPHTDKYAKTHQHTGVSSSHSYSCLTDRRDAHNSGFRQCQRHVSWYRTRLYSSTDWNPLRPVTD